MAADWHPSRNAYPVFWLLRNGRWAAPYGAIRQVERRENGQTVTGYQVKVGPDEIGVFRTGDDAAAAAWTEHLRRNQVDHGRAAKRMHERPSGGAAPP